MGVVVTHGVDNVNGKGVASGIVIEICLVKIEHSIVIFFSARQTKPARRRGASDTRALRGPTGRVFIDRDGALAPCVADQ